MVAFFDAALAEIVTAGHTYNLAGICWHQGIDDGLLTRSEANYTADLRQIVADMRTRYGKNLPFILARTFQQFWSMEFVGRFRRLEPRLPETLPRKIIPIALATCFGAPVQLSKREASEISDAGEGCESVGVSPAPPVVPVSRAAISSATAGFSSAGAWLWKKFAITFIDAS